MQSHKMIPSKYLMSYKVVLKQIMEVGPLEALKLKKEVSPHLNLTYHLRLLAVQSPNNIKGLLAD